MVEMLSPGSGGGVRMGFTFSFVRIYLLGGDYVDCGSRGGAGL